MANLIRSLIENDKKELKRLDSIAKKVESYADQMAALTDEQLQAKTAEFKSRYQKGETLDQLLPEAFAVVREAAKRVLGLYPYHVQLMGGIVLHDGNIPEMRTGEGKTLTATMPVYLNALTGEGVHVVTVNEYLATRDSTEMGELYNFLGLTVGLNINSKSSDEKREAYNCDITYSTNNELGFDYLRDNMVVYRHQMVQRPLNYAIVDEVDSILIDEARTPLIISGQAEKSTALYTKVVSSSCFSFVTILDILVLSVNAIAVSSFTISSILTIAFSSTFDCSSSIYSFTLTFLNNLLALAIAVSSFLQVLYTFR